MTAHNGNPSTIELRERILSVMRLVNGPVGWPARVISAALAEVLEECDRIPFTNTSAPRPPLGELEGELSGPTPVSMLVPGVHGGTVHTVTGVANSGLRVRLIDRKSRDTDRGVETVVRSDETFYYPTGRPFDQAETVTQERAGGLGYQLLDRCVSGAGVSLTFLIPDPPTVPETGGRISEYLTDHGTWVRCTVLTTDAAGKHSIEYDKLPAYSERVHDVSPERIRYTS